MSERFQGRAAPSPPPRGDKETGAARRFLESILLQRRSPIGRWWVVRNPPAIAQPSPLATVAGEWQADEGCVAVGVTDGVSDSRRLGAVGQIRRSVTAAAATGRRPSDQADDCYPKTCRTLTINPGRSRSPVSGRSPPTSGIKSTDIGHGHNDRH